MKKLLWLILLVPSAALAQEVTTPEVVVPWGEWASSVVDAALPALGTLLTGIVSYVVAAYVPPWLRAITGARGQERVNAVINNAVLSAVGQTKDALLGKQLTLPVASEVLRKALQYTVDQAPHLIKSASKNSVENLAKMIIARMTERGLLPPKFDMEEAKKVVVPVAPTAKKQPVVDKKKGEEFDFQNAVSKGLGGAV